MPKKRHLSSADLLTLQVLERELTDPNISENYERELRARIEYFNDTSPTESEEMTYTYKDMVSNKTLIVIKARSAAEAYRIFEEKGFENILSASNIHMITEQS
jgi:hypothetical protein